MLIARDFYCQSCGNEFEDLVEKKEKSVPCPQCKEPVEYGLSAPLFGQMNDKERRIESLKKRSLDHSKKLWKENRGNPNFGKKR